MTTKLPEKCRSVARDLNNGFPITSEKALILEQSANVIDDLYEALYRLAYLQSGGPCTGVQAEQWLEAARAALAKARGET